MLFLSASFSHTHTNCTHSSVSLAHSASSEEEYHLYLCVLQHQLFPVRHHLVGELLPLLMHKSDPTTTTSHCFMISDDYWHTLPDCSPLDVISIFLAALVHLVGSFGLLCLSCRHSKRQLMFSLKPVAPRVGEGEAE